MYRKLLNELLLLEFAPQFDEAANKYRSLMDFQHIDAEDSGNLELKEKYGIKSYPRLVYLDGKGNLLYNEGRGAFSDRLKARGCKN